MPKHFLKIIGALSLAASVVFFPILVQAQNSKDSNPHPRYQNRSAPSQSSSSSTRSSNWGSKLNEIRSSRSAPSISTSPSTRSSNYSSRSGVSTPSYRSQPSSRAGSSVPSTSIDRSFTPNPNISRNPSISGNDRPLIRRPNVTARPSNSGSREGLVRGRTRFHNPSSSVNRVSNSEDIRANNPNPVRSNQMNWNPRSSGSNTTWQNRSATVRNRSNPSRPSGTNLGLRQTVSPNPARDFNPYRNNRSSSSRSLESDHDDIFQSGVPIRGQVRSRSSVAGGGREHRNGTNLGVPRGHREKTGPPGGSTRPDHRGVPGKKGLDPPGRDPNSHRGYKPPGKKDDSHPGRGGKERFGGGYHYGGLSHLYWRGLGYGRGYYTYPSLGWDIRYSSRLYPGLTYSHRWRPLGYFYGPFILIDGYRYYSPYYYDDAYYDVYYDDAYYNSSRRTNRVILYENAGYRGHNLELYAGQSIADLSHYQTGSDRSFDDLISSVKIYGDVTLVLYEHADFHGNRVYLHNSVDDFSDEAFTVAFNDEVSSVEVLPGSYHSHGYEAHESEVGFQSGESNSFPQAEPDPSIPISPEVDSAYAPEEGIAVSQPADWGIVVILYDQSDFGGRRLELSVGDVVPNLAMRLRDVGSSWDDAVASIQVLGGAEVFLYTESDFYGAGIVLDYDVANFSLFPSLTEFAGKVSSVVVKPQ